MHRHRVAQRKKIVHHREDRFLDLTRVPRAADENDPPFEIDEHEGARARAVALRIGVEKRRIDNGELRNEVGRRRLWRDEKMMREQIMPGEFGVDADRNAIAFVGAGVAIQRVDFALGKVRADAIPECVELRGFDRLVRRAPVDMRFARRLAHEELIFRRAPGVRTRIDDELSAWSEHALATFDRMFDELRNRKVLVQLNDVEFFRQRKNDRPLLQYSKCPLRCFSEARGRACRRRLSAVQSNGDADA